MLYSICKSLFNIKICWIKIITINYNIFFCIKCTKNSVITTFSWDFRLTLISVAICCVTNASPWHFFLPSTTFFVIVAIIMIPQLTAGPFFNKSFPLLELGNIISASAWHRPLCPLFLSVPASILHGCLYPTIFRTATAIPIAIALAVAWKLKKELVEVEAKPRETKRFRIIEIIGKSIEAPPTKG